MRAACAALIPSQSILERHRVVHVLVVALVAQRTLVRIAVVAGLRHNVRTGFNTVFFIERNVEVPTAGILAAGGVCAVASNTAHAAVSIRTGSPVHGHFRIFKRSERQVRRRMRTTVLINRAIVGVIDVLNHRAHRDAAGVTILILIVVEVAVAVRAPSAHAAVVRNVIVRGFRRTGTGERETFSDRGSLRKVVVTGHDMVASAVEQTIVHVAVRVVAARAAQRRRRIGTARSNRIQTVNHRAAARRNDSVASAPTRNRIGTAIVAVVDVVFQQEGKVTRAAFGRRGHRIATPNRAAAGSVAGQAKIRRIRLLQQILVTLARRIDQVAIAIRIVHGVAARAVRNAFIMESKCVRYLQHKQSRKRQDQKHRPSH